MKKIIVSICSIFILCAINTNASTRINNNKTTIKNIKDMTIINLTKEVFLKKVANYESNPDEWIYLGDKPCIIDFYADWCAPCKALSPTLDELAKEYGDKLIIYKVNTEIERDLSEAFGIRSIPTLIFCPMNEAPRIANGALPKNELQRIISEVLMVQ